MKIVYSHFKKSQLKTKISILKTCKALVGSSIILFDMLTREYKHQEITFYNKLKKDYK
jgi:hypothetical protein